MELGLKGRHVAILAADGVDAAQLESLRNALTGAGAVADVVAARGGMLRTTGGEAVPADRTFDVCHAADYDALVIPGGAEGTRALGGESRAVQFVREFMVADKPVAAVAEGVRLLVAADAVAGRAVAADRTLGGEVEKAGGELVDTPVHVDEKLVTASASRDLRALNEAMLREFANRVDEARVDQLSEQSFPASDPPPGPTSVGGEGASRELHLDPKRPSAGRSRGDGDSSSAPSRSPI